MFDHIIPGTERLGQPALGSVYDKSGTPESGYEERGPYHCEDCIHKTAPDEPFCIHPKVIADSKLQDRLVLINNRPVIKVCLERGCCEFVRQAAHDDDDDDEGHEE